MLRWFGYYTEEVPDSRIENVRIRKVVIRYYLENDTMDVLEPRQTNSGMDQASLAGRPVCMPQRDRDIPPPLRCRDAKGSLEQSAWLFLRWLSFPRGLGLCLLPCCVCIEAAC